MSHAFLARVLALALAWSVAPAPAYAAPASGQPVDGIRCDEAEGAVFHIHQHLSIYIHGKPVTVPAGIGIPQGSACLYWVHTHDVDGIIHVESPVFRSFTLGNFFDIWGEPLGPTGVLGTRVSKGQVRVYLDGRRYTGDLRKLELLQHSDIVIEVGAPYPMPKNFTAWKGL